MALTLRELYNLYLRDNHTIQQTTKKRTRRACAPLLTLFGERAGADVTRADAATYQALLIEGGKSAATVNSYTAQVSAVFGWHVQLGRLAANPFAGLRKVREHRRAVSFYEQPEIDRLLDAVHQLRWRDPTAPVRLRGILLMCYHAALRIGETVNLRWLDIDLEQAVVKVQYRAAKAGQWWTWGSKGLADRVVPMSQDLLDHCYRMRVVCPWLYPFLPAARCRALQQRATKLSEDRSKRPDNNLYRALNRIKRHAGIETGAFHELRRTAATELAEGLQPTDLQQVMGHRSFSTTQRYIGVRHNRYLDSTREAMNARCHSKEQ